MNFEICWGDTDVLMVFLNVGFNLQAGSGWSD